MKVVTVTVNRLCSNALLVHGWFCYICSIALFDFLFCWSPVPFCSVMSLCSVLLCWFCHPLCLSSCSCLLCCLSCLCEPVCFGHAICLVLFWALLLVSVFPPVLGWSEVWAVWESNLGGGGLCDKPALQTLEVRGSDNDLKISSVNAD